MSELELKIKSMLEEKVNHPFEYDRNLHLINDLGINSIEMLELIVQIEDDLDIVFDDEDMDINIIGNLGSLIDLVEKKLMLK